MALKKYADMNLQEKNEYLLKQLDYRNDDIKKLQDKIKTLSAKLLAERSEFQGYKEAVVQFTGDDLREQMSDLDQRIRTEIVKLKNTLDMFERKLKK